MSQQIGIIAPSSQVPKVELQLGVERLKQEGFGVQVHKQVKKSHLFLAGKDEERAQAFLDYAYDPRISVLWTGRGGYGSIRVLPLLDRAVAERGLPPRKLLAGFSDTTAIMHYVQDQWNWSALHAAMPGGRIFFLQKEAEWKALMAWVRQEKAALPFSRKLRFATARPGSVIEAPLVGGNLSVWASLAGTSYQPNAEGKIVFFEDVTESLYRLDRMLQQVALAGMLRGAKAIVLGNFDACGDTPPSGLARLPAPKRMKQVLERPGPRDLAPLRKKLAPEKTIPLIFGEVGEKLGIPVAFGLPVGHGPEYAPLPLGARYRLSPEGRLELVSWDWIK